MVDTIIDWLWGLVKIIPEDIIKGLIASFVILILRMLANKVKFLNSKTKNIILNLLEAKIEFSPKIVFIESPDYHYTAKRREVNIRNGNFGDSDVFGIIVLVMFGASIVVSLFIKYANYISLFLKWFGLIPLMISIVFLFIISFSNEVQKVTVKFIIVSIVVSILTLYYGFSIKEIASTMSPTIMNTGKFFISVYKILGISIGVVQQLISYVLLFRVISVYIDRKKKKPIQSIRYFIARTKHFESIFNLIFLIIFSSILSYGLTLEIVHKFLLRQ